MARTPRPPRADRAAEQAYYAAWKLAAVTELTNRHEVNADTIPERVWRQLYIQGRTPQAAADQAAVSAYNVGTAADRVRKR
jgi:hypothetical protein